MGKLTTESLIGQIQALEAVVCGLIAACPNMDLLRNVVGNRMAIAEEVYARNPNQDGAQKIVDAMHTTVDGLFSAVPGQIGPKRSG